MLSVLGIAGVSTVAGCSSSGDDRGPSPTSAENENATTLLSEAVSGEPEKITATDGDANDYFGRSVALSGDGTTAVVGAYYDEDPNGPYSGSASVFNYADGSWSREAKLAPGSGREREKFGISVDITEAGNTILVGAYGDRSVGGDINVSGSAYVFTRTDSAWNLQTKLTPDESAQLFGRSVALSSEGNIAVVGDNFDPDPNGEQGGSAYIFENSGGSWNRISKLAASHGESGGRFGETVTISDDASTVIVGEPSLNSGTAYVFARSGGTWQQQTDFNLENGDYFGRILDVSGDGTAAIVGDEGAGVFAIFEKNGDSWSQQTSISSDGRPSGAWIANDGKTAITIAKNAAGKIYNFSGGSWNENVIFAPDTEESSIYKESLSVAETGNTVIIGDSQDDSVAENAGAAYIFADK